MSDEEQQQNPPVDGPELKAGHPPAVKVGGGVRITQRRLPSESDKEKDKAVKDAEKEQSEEKPNPNEERRLFVSGAEAKGNRDFPPEAIKSFHEKPMPTHQEPHQSYQQKIQQPRKHNM